VISVGTKPTCPTVSPVSGSSAGSGVTVSTTASPSRSTSRSVASPGRARISSRSSRKSSERASPTPTTRSPTSRPAASAGLSSSTSPTTGPISPVGCGTRRYIASSTAMAMTKCITEPATSTMARCQAGRSWKNRPRSPSSSRWWRSPTRPASGTSVTSTSVRVRRASPGRVVRGVGPGAPHDALGQVLRVPRCRSSAAEPLPGGGGEPRAARRRVDASRDGRELRGRSRSAATACGSKTVSTSGAGAVRRSGTCPGSARTRRAAAP
jgi:hypothetical protein